MASSCGCINERAVAMDLPFAKSSGSGPCHASAAVNPGKSPSETGAGGWREAGGGARRAPLVGRAEGA